MSGRRFYKTVLRVEVLSESPIGAPNLYELHDLITVGDCSGVIKPISLTNLTGAEAATALLEQGSDPEFFMLDRDGNDLPDDCQGSELKEVPYDRDEEGE